MKQRTKQETKMESSDFETPTPTHDAADDDEDGVIELWRRIWNDAASKDTELRCGDGVVFAHGAVLRNAGSAVLREMAGERSSSSSSIPHHAGSISALTSGVFSASNHAHFPHGAVPFFPIPGALSHPGVAASAFDRKFDFSAPFLSPLTAPFIPAPAMMTPGLTAPTIPTTLIPSPTIMTPPMSAPSIFASAMFTPPISTFPPGAAGVVAAAVKDASASKKSGSIPGVDGVTLTLVDDDVAAADLDAVLRRIYLGGAGVKKKSAGPKNDAGFDAESWERLATLARRLGVDMEPRMEPSESQTNSSSSSSSSSFRRVHQTLCQNLFNDDESKDVRISFSLSLPSPQTRTTLDHTNSPQNLSPSVPSFNSPLQHVSATPDHASPTLSAHNHASPTSSSLRLKTELQSFTSSHFQADDETVGRTESSVFVGHRDPTRSDVANRFDDPFATSPSPNNLLPTPAPRHPSPAPPRPSPPQLRAHSFLLLNSGSVVLCHLVRSAPRGSDGAMEIRFGAESDVDRGAFEEVLRFLYFGSLPPTSLTLSRLSTLLPTASKLRLQPLVRLCREAVVSASTAAAVKGIAVGGDAALALDVALKNNVEGIAKRMVEVLDSLEIPTTDEFIEIVSLEALWFLLSESRHFSATQPTTARSLWLLKWYKSHSSSSSSSSSLPHFLRLLRSRSVFISADDLIEGLARGILGSAEVVEINKEMKRMRMTTTTTTTTTTAAQNLVKSDDDVKDVKHSVGNGVKNGEGDGVGVTNGGGVGASVKNGSVGVGATNGSGVGASVKGEEKHFPSEEKPKKNGKRKNKSAGDDGDRVKRERNVDGERLETEKNGEDRERVEERDNGLNGDGVHVSVCEAGEENNDGERDVPAKRVVNEEKDDAEGERVDSPPPKRTKKHRRRESRADDDNNDDDDDEGRKRLRWKLYLRENGFEAAPLEAFKQTSPPPKHKFKEGMYLEVHDTELNKEAKASWDSCYLAQIKQVAGNRIELQLVFTEGNDPSNNFWQIVDSCCLKPVGFTERTFHRPPDPPPVSNIDLYSWRRRVQTKIRKILAAAEAAPEKIFMEEPARPMTNLFRRGQRLEAVDRKNPSLLCPARIDCVVGDKLFVAFEGFGDAFSYWCDRDDRFLFPVNWHKKTGDKLEPIGPED